MDTVIVIFEFSPRDLLSLTSTSKELIERLTYSHVIRSSLFRGGAFYKATIQSIKIITQV